MTSITVEIQGYNLHVPDFFQVRLLKAVFQCLTNYHEQLQTMQQTNNQAQRVVSCSCVTARFYIVLMEKISASKEVFSQRLLQPL